MPKQCSVTCNMQRNKKFKIGDIVEVHHPVSDLILFGKINNIDKSCKFYYYKIFDCFSMHKIWCRKENLRHLTDAELFLHIMEH